MDISTPAEQPQTNSEASSTQLPREYEYHPAAQVFPLMVGPSFDALALDIEQHGQREPIVRHKGQILDGRNRLRACLKVGVTPSFVDRDEIESPVAYAVSANIRRRQLSEAQSAALAAELVEMFEAEARERQHQAGARGAEGGRGKKKTQRDGSSRRDAESGKSTTRAARAVGAGITSTKKMKRLKVKAPDVFEGVKQGKIRSVAEAERLASAPKPNHQTEVTPPMPPSNLTSDRVTVHFGEIGIVTDEIDDGSVGLIFVDRTCGDSDLGALATLANRILRQGALVAVLAEPSLLADVFMAAGNELEYRGIAPLRVRAKRSNATKLNTSHRYVVWYTRADETPSRWVSDRFNIEEEDGGEQLPLAIVNALSESGDTVFDPLCSPELAASVVESGRRFIGVTAEENRKREMETKFPESATAA